MTKNVRPLGDFLLALAGPIVWAAHFFVVYGFEAVICTRVSSPDYVMRWIIAAATVAAIGALAVFLLRNWARHSQDPDTAQFLRHIYAALAIISMGAVIGAALPSLTLPACMSPAG